MRQFQFSVFLSALLLLTSGCTSAETEHPITSESGVRIDLDSDDERRLLSFYIGGMVSDDGADPFDAGFVTESGRRFFLDVDKIQERHPDLGAALKRATGDGELNWDELAPIIEEYYYEYRKLPRTIDELTEIFGNWREGEGWFNFEVNGVMSPHTRRIHVKNSVIETALRNYQTAGDRLIYEAGSTFISEHIFEARLVELSVMTKRNDGHWDFYAYNESGQYAKAVDREPSALTVPTKCVGCHFGNRLFEPERSFPAQAGDGPDGPRKLHVSGREKNAEIVARMDEHRKRSDTILGLYGTLYLSRLKFDPEIDPEWSDLLNALDL